MEKTLLFRRLGKSLSVALILTLMMLSLVNESHAQDNQVTVSGTITDERGQGLPGATVSVKGTQNGAITDVNGKYTLNMPVNGTIMVTFTGFIPQEVSIGGRSVVDFILKEDIGLLEEVVVLGYGTQKKSDITGAVGVVGAEELDDAIFNTVDQMLQGRAAGVQITNTSGEPGAAPRIRIRGNSSINASSDPLWVVDGIPLTTAPSFSPQEIESFEVLKDAAATAIYGARGAAGVIIVETKRGRSDSKTVIEASVITTATNVNLDDGYDVLGGTDYADYRNEIADFLGSPLPFPDGVGDLEDIDWADQIFGSGLRQEYNLAARGGGKSTGFYVAGNYLTEAGVLKNTEFERISFRANFDFSGFNDKLKINTSANITREENNGGISGGGGFRNGAGGAYLNSLIAEPLVPSLDYSGTSSTGNIFANPYIDVTRDIRDRIQTNLFFSVQTSYDITEDLTFINNVSTNLRNSSSNRFAPREVASAALVNGRTDNASQRNEDLIVTNYLRYDKNIGDKHQLNALGGVEYSEFNFFEQQANGTQIDLVVFGYDNIAVANEQSISSNRTKSVIQSGFLRADYSFDDKYSFNGTIRADGASVFAENNKWGYFPSFGFAWNAINESFLDTQNFFSDLRFRTSWGQVGVQAIAPYNSLSLLSSSLGSGGRTGVFSGNGNSATPGISPLRLANDNLKWETTETFNVGLDFSILGNKLLFTTDYYIKTSRDLLQSVALPSQVGFTTALVNLGEIQNKGVEINILASPVDTENFSWTSSLNVTANRSEVINLGDNPRLIVGGTHVFLPGEEYGLFFGRRNAGLIQQSDFDADGNPLFPTFGPDQALGQIKYQDLDGDGTIGNPDEVNGFDSDETIIGNPNPDFIFGWNNDFTYRNFSLNIFIQGSVGNDIMNQTGALLHSGNAANDLDDITNQSVDYYNNRFIPGVNEHNDPRYPRSGSTAVPYAPLRGIVSDVWIEDGSYVRLKSITLRYNLPVKNVNLDFYVVGTNLLTITGYSGIDPDVSQNVSDASLRQGVDLSPYPFARQYTIGMNVNF